GVRLIYSPAGGIDVESHAPGEGGCNVLLPLERAALRRGAQDAARFVAEGHRRSFVDLCGKLIELFMSRRLMLAEINPLFAREDGSFVAADAKVVIDMNAVPTQPELKELLTRRKSLYPEAWRKLSLDFDFI